MQEMVTQTKDLQNPIDDEIKETLKENQNSTVLLSILKSIKTQYSNMKIEQLKLNIDRIMSSSPACIDKEVIKRCLRNFISNLDKEAQTLASKSFAKVLDATSDIRKSNNIKDEILSSQQSISRQQYNSNQSDIASGQNPFE